MYQGKFNNKPVRHRRKGKKSLVLMVSLVMLVCLVVGGTAAFLVTESDSVTNNFIPGKVTTYVNESISGDTKSNVTIENTGNTDAWIRAAIVVNWKKTVDGQEYIYGTKPVAGTDYSVTNIGIDWIVDDGYYYWHETVAPGENTGKLIESVQYLGNAPEGYSLSVEILASGIQSKPNDMLANVWGIPDGYILDTTSTHLVKAN